MLFCLNSISNLNVKYTVSSWPHRTIPDQITVGCQPHRNQRWFS